MNVFKFLLGIEISPRENRRTYLRQWKKQTYKISGSIPDSDILKNAIRSYGNLEGGKVRLGNF